MLARLESADQLGKSSQAASGSVAVRPEGCSGYDRFSSDGINSGQWRSSPAIIPPASETLEESRERSEAAPVDSGGETTDLEKLVDQFQEFTEFLKWKKLVKQEKDLKDQDEELSLVKKSESPVSPLRDPTVQSSVLSPESAPIQPQRLNTTAVADLTSAEAGGGERPPGYSLHLVSGRDSLTSLIAESNSQERFISILENISLF